MVISMLTVGGIFVILFVYVEWKVSRLPMMPRQYSLFHLKRDVSTNLLSVSLFKNKPVAAMLFQNFFFGIVFYNYLYYLPLYYQNVRRLTPIHSALLTLPLVLTQRYIHSGFGSIGNANSSLSFASILSGQYISRRKRYGEVIWLGFTLFTLGTGLTTLFTRETATWKIIVILIVLGYGNGNCFQPTIIALQAHCLKSQRAVVISVRNFLRCLGGSIGLAVSAAILQNTLRGELPEQYKYLAKSTYTKPDYSQFSAADGDAINEAYAKASRAVFIFMAPCAAVCLVSCIFVKDRGLVRPEELAEQAAKRAADAADEEKGVTAGSVHSIESEDKEKRIEDIEAEKVLEVGIVKAL
jgi:MFS family permease